MGSARNGVLSIHNPLSREKSPCTLYYSALGIVIYYEGGGFTMYGGNIHSLRKWWVHYQGRG